ncbi:MAG: hypothetical protein LZF86_140010 [Nitrospira sp.]|nr:MAG: hypothetical protein LZF86_140010 [Nitrospira sp.]
MTERPILMTQGNAQKCHDGTKTMTRRTSGLSIINERPNEWDLMLFDGELAQFSRCRGSARASIRCPYGQVGDRLRINEPHYLYGHWKKNGTTKTGRQKWRFACDPSRGARFPDRAPNRVLRGPLAIDGWFRRHARFMPKWAARTVVEITELRIEWVQAITPEEARAEGCEDAICALGAFAELYDSIYGQGSWARNDWVWVIGFRRVGG